MTFVPMEEHHASTKEEESSGKDVDLLDLYLQDGGPRRMTNNGGIARTRGLLVLGAYDEDDSEEEAKKQHQKKERFFREIIKLVLLVDPPVKWRVERFRLTPEFLQQLIDRVLLSEQQQQQQQQQEKEEKEEQEQKQQHQSVTTSTSGVSIAYLKTFNTKDSRAKGFGGGKGGGSIIIIPADVQRLCNKDDTYEIVLSYPNRTVDSIKDDSYVGQMHFVLRNVPLQSQNNLYPVKGQHIQQWIRQSLLREDLDLMQLEIQLSKIDSAVKMMTKRMENIAQELFFDRKGVLMKGPSAEIKRKELYDLLEEKKRALQEEIEHKKEEKLKIYHKKCDDIDLRIFQSDDDNHTTWTVELNGCHKEYYEKLILKNSNWKTTLMYAYPGDDDYEQQKERLQGTRSEYLVDVTNISVERVEHGFGCYHYHHHAGDAVESSNGDPGRCTAYHGTYYNGLRHGSGIMYTSSYMYCFSFHRGEKNGIGTMVQKDGDVMRSTFGLSSKVVGSKRKNHYVKGLPNGKSTITFSDGAYYEGEMQNGMITGQGVYISAKGDKMKGQFVNGVMVRGTMQTWNGEIYDGQFKDGLLHDRKGIYESKSKRSIYKGAFLDGEKHGSGIETFYRKNKAVEEPLAIYEGSFVNNCRSGIGCMELKDSGFDYENRKKENLRIDSPYIAGEPTRGGMITNVDMHCSIPTTTRPSSRYRLLNRFRRVEERKDAHLLRNIQENQLQQHLFRAILEAKKKEIYDAHHQNLLKMCLNGKGTNDCQMEDQNLCPRRISRHDINSFRVYAPRSLHEAEVCPGLKIQSATSDTCNEESVLQGLIRSIQEGWSVRGIDFKKWTPFMQPATVEYHLIQEKWDNINIDQIWGQVLLSTKSEL